MAISRKMKKDVMTIPQLRQSMMHITNYAQNLVKSKKPNPVRAFQAEWQATFHKPLLTKVSDPHHFKRDECREKVRMILKR